METKREDYHSDDDFYYALEKEMWNEYFRQVGTDRFEEERIRHGIDDKSLPF